MLYQRGIQLCVGPNLPKRFKTKYLRIRFYSIFNFYLILDADSAKFQL